MSKKPQLQSVLSFFKFVLSRALLYLPLFFILSLNGFFFLLIDQLVFTVGLQHSIRDTLNSVSLLNTYFIVRSCMRI